MPAQPTDLSRRVQQQFGAASARYVTSVVHAGGPDLEALVREAKLQGSERVLDIGCGAGHTALALAPAAAAVTALDLTPAMLAEVERQAAERGLANLVTREGDAAALPFADASFDRVACRLCAHHFEQPARAVREAARVLAPGGRLLWIDTVSPEAPALDTWLNTIELLRDPSHVRNHTVAQWQQMMRDAGLRPLGLLEWPIPLECESWMERIGTPEANRATLRTMLREATSETRAHFGIETHADGSLHFTLPNAFLWAEAG